ncbi:hypothetical protein [Deinococcus marmoris]|uniref:hypothetical protein n=1 Tax=Deinococcus marmoris TaxID=249408 RepID=UPI0004965219|nr:hypothetical protein [Deinococcus marmoris]
MSYLYPTEPAWWSALCFRLSGPENIPVRRLIALSAELPLQGFLALAQDTEPEVLSALSENPALPPDLSLQLFRHPDAEEFLPEDKAWFDRLLTRPELTSDDLIMVMERVSGDGMEEAILHPNADWSVLEDYFRCYGRVDSPELAGKLLRRFPWGGHQ